MRDGANVTDPELGQLRLSAIVALAIRPGADRRPPFGEIGLIASADPDQAARILGVRRIGGPRSAAPCPYFTRAAIDALRVNRRPARA